jgi:hypothetical protein
MQKDRRKTIELDPGAPSKLCLGGKVRTGQALIGKVGFQELGAPLPFLEYLFSKRKNRL